MFHAEDREKQGMQRRKQYERRLYVLKTMIRMSNNRIRAAIVTVDPVVAKALIGKLMEKSRI